MSVGGHDGSISYWIDALKAGNPDAAQPLWERYFDRLVRLAAAKLREARRLGIAEDGEDAALSAFDSLCAGAMNGRFPRLSDRDELWSLLVVITARKALDQIERGRAKKRGGGRVVPESLLELPGEGGARAFEMIEGPGPSPEFAAMFAEEYRLRLESLPDEKYRSIAVCRMEGYTREEIALKLGCSTKTVANKLEYIRKAWIGDAP